MPYVTSVDTEFSSQIDQMKLVSTAADAAAELTGQRMWMYPPLNSWSGDPYDIIGMNSAFVRDNLNGTYITIISDPLGLGTIGEAMAEKIQIDYIAALERAFRTRHCSSIRAKLHAAARRKGHGQSTGLYDGSVTTWLEQIIFAAHDDPWAGVPPGGPPNA